MKKCDRPKALQCAHYVENYGICNFAVLASENFCPGCGLWRRDEREPGVQLERACANAVWALFVLSPAIALCALLIEWNVTERLSEDLLLPILVTGATVLALILAADTLMRWSQRRRLGARPAESVASLERAVRLRLRSADVELKSIDDAIALAAEPPGVSHEDLRALVCARDERLRVISETRLALHGAEYVRWSRWVRLLFEPLGDAENAAAARLDEVLPVARFGEDLVHALESDSWLSDHAEEALAGDLAAALGRNLDALDALSATLTSVRGLASAGRLVPVDLAALCPSFSTETWLLVLRWSASNRGTLIGETERISA